MLAAASGCRQGLPACWRSRRRRRRRRRARRRRVARRAAVAVTTAPVVAKPMAVKVRARRQRRSVLDGRRALAGHRRAADGRVHRRPGRPRGPAAVHDRPAPFEVGAEAGRSGARARHRAGEERSKRSVRAVERPAQARARLARRLRRERPRRRRPMRRIVDADTAAIENAQHPAAVHTKITAPVAGRTGALLVHPRLARARQRHGAARRHQPARAGVRELRGAGAAAAAAARARPGGALPVEAVAGRRHGQHVDGHGHVHRQRRRSGHRHDSAQGDLPEPRPPALARRVRGRDAPALGRPRSHRRADARGAAEPAGPVRLRRQGGPDRRGPPGQGRLDRRRRDGDRRPASRPARRS